MFDFDDEDTENPIGSLLRYHREEIGESLEEISERLKVRPEYLKAMEQGRFDLLPAGFYRRSFLKAYAQYLRLDAEHLLRMLDEQNERIKEGKGEVPSEAKIFPEQTSEVNKIKRKSSTGEVTPAIKPSSKESQISFWFSVFLGLVIGSLCLVFFFQLGKRENKNALLEQDVAQAESLMISPEPLDTLTLFLNLLDEKIKKAPELNLRIEAEGESWIRVVSDGTELFTGFVNQNIDVEFKAKDRFTINLGKNQGVKAWLNGFELMSLKKGITRLNRENFKEFILTARATEMVREYNE